MEKITANPAAFFLFICLFICRGFAQFCGLGAFHQAVGVVGNYLGIPKANAPSGHGSIDSQADDLLSFFGALKKKLERLINWKEPAPKCDYPFWCIYA